MFQEKEVLEYQSHKAPEGLKNRIWTSIEFERKRVRAQRKKWVATAACFVGVLFAGSFMYQSSAIVRINEVPISYLSVSVGENIGNTPVLVSEGKNKSIQEKVPLELQVRKNAHVEVSKGKLCMEKEGSAETNGVMEMDVLKDTVVYWYVGDKENSARCIITIADKEYHYVMEKEDACWKIQLKETK